MRDGYDQDFRFSHDKTRFSKLIRNDKWTFEDFMSRANQLKEIVVENNPGTTIEVLSAETPWVYRAMQRTTMSPEIVAASKARVKYEFSTLGENEWNKSYKLSAFFHTPQSEHGMVVIGCDRIEGDRIDFYGQQLNKLTADQIAEGFKESGFTFTIGDGFGRKKPNVSEGIAALVRAGVKVNYW